METIFNSEQKTDIQAPRAQSLKIEDSTTNIKRNSNTQVNNYKVREKATLKILDSRIYNVYLFLEGDQGLTMRSRIQMNILLLTSH